MASATPAVTAPFELDLQTSPAPTILPDQYSDAPAGELDTTISALDTNVIKRPTSTKRSVQSSTPWSRASNVWVVLDSICSHLDPQDLLALRRTSKENRDLVDSICQSQWNINRFLSRWVVNPIDFRIMMGMTRALILGSAALEFLCRAAWPVSVLHIYSEIFEGQHFRLAKYLVRIEGYVLLDKTEPPGGDAIEQGTWLVSRHFLVKVPTLIDIQLRRTRTDGQYDWIQVNQTRTSPITAALKLPFGSLLATIISCDTAYCLFPDATFRERICYPFSVWQPNLDFVAREYEKLGWRIVKDCNEANIGVPISMANDTRSPADSLSWKVPLNTTGLHSTERLPKEVFQYSFFSMWRFQPIRLHRIQPPPQEQSYYFISADDYRASILRYTYMRPDLPHLRHLTLPDFWMSMKVYHDRLTSDRLRKLSSKHRKRLLKKADIRWSPYDKFFYADGTNVDCLANAVRDLTPYDWRFCDGRIETWYLAWKSHCALLHIEAFDDYFEELEVSEPWVKRSGGEE